MYVQYMRQSGYRNRNKKKVMCIFAPTPSPFGSMSTYARAEHSYLFSLRGETEGHGAGHHGLRVTLIWDHVRIDVPCIPWWSCTSCAARVMSNPRCLVLSCLHCTALYCTTDVNHASDSTNRRVEEMAHMSKVTNPEIPPVAPYTGFHAALSSCKQCAMRDGCCEFFLFLFFMSRIGLKLTPGITSTHEQRLLCQHRPPLWDVPANTDKSFYYCTVP